MIAAEPMSHVRYISGFNPTPKEFDFFVKGQPLERDAFGASLSSKNFPLALHLIQKLGREGVNAPDSQGLTPLLSVCVAEIRSWINSVEVTILAQSLIAEGADVNRGSVSQHVPLHRHYHIPRGATLLWIALEHTSSVGLSLILREKEASIYPQLSEHAERKKQFVDVILKMKREECKPAVQALQGLDVCAFLSALPKDLKNSVNELFTPRPEEADDAIVMFIQSNSLINEATLSLAKQQHPLILHLITDRDIRNYKSYISVVEHNLEEVKKYGQDRNCYQCLLNSPDDEIKIGNQTLPTLQGVQKKLETLRTQVHNLPALRDQAQVQRTRKNRVFWTLLAVAVGASALFVLRQLGVFQRLKRG